MTNAAASLHVVEIQPKFRALLNWDQMVSVEMPALCCILTPEEVENLAGVRKWQLCLRESKHDFRLPATIDAAKTVALKTFDAQTFVRCIISTLCGLLPWARLIGAMYRR